MTEIIMNQKEKISKIISALFFPMINTIIVFSLVIFLNKYNTPKENSYFFMLIILFFVVIPILLMWILKKFKMIKSFDVFERQKRIIPFIFTIISYSLGFVILLYAKDSPVFLKSMTLCYIINTVVILIVTIWWKMSVHAMAIAGPIVGLHYFFGNVILPFYLLIILVGYSRVVLKRHTIAQVIAGGLTGVLLTAVQMYFYLDLF